MASSSTITVQKLIDFTLPWVDNIPLTRNGSTEPALSIANIVMQTIIQPPLRWRWNRIVTGFVCTTGGVQDYKLGNWAASTSFAVGLRVIDSNGYSQRVTTAGTSGSNQPSWNTSSTTTDGTVVWTNDGAIPNASSPYTFYWIENASVKDTAPTTPKWYQFTTKRDLALDTSQARPQFVSPEFDNGAGIVTFRLQPVPDIAYPIALTVQQKPIPITSLNQTFSPIPDEYAYLLRYGFLAWSNFYLGRIPDFQLANQKFIGGILSADNGLTDTEKNIFLAQANAFERQQLGLGLSLQQATQARGI